MSEFSEILGLVDEDDTTTTNLSLIKPSNSSLNYRAKMNANLDIIDRICTELNDFSQNISTTTGLYFGYNGGNVRAKNIVTNIPADTILLTPSDTNYVEINTVSMAIESNVVGFTANFIPLYQIETSLTGITYVRTSRSFLEINNNFEINIIDYTAGVDIGNGTNALNAAFALAVLDVPTGGTLVFPNMYDGCVYTLGASITIPPDITLDIRPGTYIKGSYTITGDNTQLIVTNDKKFDETVTLNGTWRVQDSIIPQVFGAVGDDSYDNAISLQKCFDFQFDNQIKMFIPAGTYKTTTALTIWSVSDQNMNYETVIFGAGRNNTIIKKYGNVGIDNNLGTTVDTLIIIKNEILRTGVTLTPAEYYTDKTCCRNVNLANLQLSFNGNQSLNRVKYGIYSLGLAHCNFENLILEYFESGMWSWQWNMYCSYTKVRILVPDFGFNFVCPSGGNTTMNFKDCYIESPLGAAFKLKGGGILTNCPSDGGYGLYAEFYGGRFIIDYGYTESPSNLGVLKVINAYVLCRMCSFGMSDNNTITNFEVEGYGKLILEKCEIYPWTIPVVSTLYSCEIGAEFIVSNPTYLEPADFSTYLPVPRQENEVLTIWDRDRATNPRNDFMHYVPVATAALDYSVLTVTEDAVTHRLKLECLGDIAKYAGYQAITFTTPVKVDSYSRLKMIATLSNTWGVNSKLSILGLTKELTVDGTVTPDTTLPTDWNDFNYSASSYSYYDEVDHVFWVDVSNLFGEYYVFVTVPWYTPAFTLEIKRIELLK